MTSGAEGSTLDRPLYTIENAFNLGPTDIKIDPSGKYIAASSMDNSIKVFSLMEMQPGDKEGSYKLECEAPGEIANAWKVDFSPDGE